MTVEHKSNQPPIMPTILALCLYGELVKTGSCNLEMLKTVLKKISESEPISVMLRSALEKSRMPNKEVFLKGGENHDS